MGEQVEEKINGQCFFLPPMPHPLHPFQRAAQSRPELDRWSFYETIPRNRTTCERARAALARNEIGIREEADARKQALASAEVWDLVAKASKILVAGGRKVEEVVPREAAKEELLAKIIGRSGTLRAPALRQGDVFYIGYNDELYRLITSR
jgi:arsenate reductase-like glutaredoxin family protein